MNFNFIVILLLTLACSVVHAQEQSYSMPQIIITSPSPPGTESVVVPNDYINCFTLPEGYYDNVWTADRQVCKYDTPNHAAWVSGYWRCTQHDLEGSCANWDWVGPHWTNTEFLY